MKEVNPKNKPAVNFFYYFSQRNSGYKP